MDEKTLLLKFWEKEAPVTRKVISRHHRGQLSTYLRPMGSTVPQIYGPSADEPM